MVLPRLNCPHYGELEPVGGQPGQQVPGPLLRILVAGGAGHVQGRADHVTELEAAVPVDVQPAHVAVRLRTIRIIGIAASSLAMQNATRPLSETVTRTPITMLPITQALP